MYTIEPDFQGFQIFTHAQGHLRVSLVEQRIGKHTCNNQNLVPIPIKTELWNANLNPLFDDDAHYRFV